MKAIRKVFLIFLVALLIVFPCQITSSAASDDPDGENNSQVIISASAGQNGSYRYDAEKNEEIYIPADETFESMEIADDVFDAAPAPEQEAADCELNAAIEEEMWALANSTDKRLPVTNPSGFERSTCIIVARFADGDDNVLVGTGWLINNNYVVTAGHCVFDPNYLNNGRNGWAQHVAVYVGANNGSYIHYSMSTTYEAGGDFISCRTEEDYRDRGVYDDWAVLKLNYPVTASVAKLGLRKTNSASEMRNKTYTTQGYPLDLNYGKGWSKRTMYKQTNIIVEKDVPQPYILDLVYSSNLRYFDGQSGSALYQGGFAEGICVAELQQVSCIVLINDWLYNHINREYLQINS